MRRAVPYLVLKDRPRQRGVAKQTSRQRLKRRVAPAFVNCSCIEDSTQLRRSPYPLLPTMARCHRSCAYVTSPFFSASSSAISTVASAATAPRSISVRCGAVIAIPSTTLRSHSGNGARKWTTSPEELSRRLVEISMGLSRPPGRFNMPAAVRWEPCPPDQRQAALSSERVDCGTPATKYTPGKARTNFPVATRWSISRSVRPVARAW
jgi:hypothetical protein